MTRNLKLSCFNVTEKKANKLIVVNLKSGGIVSLDSKHAEKYHNFEKGIFTETDDDFIKELFYGEMIVDKDFDEYKELLVESNILRFASDVLNLTIAPTTACNFRCPYCYEQGCQIHTMTKETVNQLSQFVKNYYPHIANLNITWYGGEPLLEVDLIKEITQQLKQAVKPDCHYEATIVTNGFLLTPGIAQTLKQCGIKSAQITIDGSKADHDSRRIPPNGKPTFEKILDNISLVSDILNITIRINADKTNMLNASELFSHLEKRSLKDKVKFYISPVTDFNSPISDMGSCFTPQEFSSAEMDFYKIAIQRGFTIDPLRERFGIGICGAVSLNSFVVDPLGNLYKCWDDIGITDEIVGSIYDPPELTSNIIKWLSYNPQHEGCSECSVFPICMGGCPRLIVHDKEPLCETFKYNLSARVNLLQDLQSND